MTAQISVLLANLDHLSPGMLSMELSLSAMMHRRGLLADIRYFRFGPSRPGADDWAQLPFSCGDAIGKLDEIVESDAIIYWGADNHHTAPHVRETSWPFMHQGAKSPDEGLDMHYRYKFLEGFPEEIRRRVIAFGGSIATYLGPNSTDERYLRNASTLFREAKFAGFRDMHSAALAAHMTGNYHSSFLVSDAALSLDASTTDLLPTIGIEDGKLPSTRGKRVAVFLGRTRGLGNYRHAVRFIRRFCKAAKLEMVWIPWLPRRSSYHEYVLYRPVGAGGLAKDKRRSPGLF